MSAVKKITDYDNTSNVIPFRRQSEPVSLGSSPFDIFDSIFNDPEFDTKWKTYVESKILGVYLSQSLEALEQNDSPFDAIYISELKPDSLAQVRFDAILATKAIVDKSHQISFDDGWDDE